METFDDILDMDEQGPNQNDYADFGTRLVAYFIDGIILTFGSFFLMFPFIAFSEAASSGGGDALDSLRGLITIFVFPVGYLAYYGFFESSKYGGTPGKMAMKICVTNINGYPVSFWQAVGRNAGKFISQLILYIGYLMALWTPKKQTLHDQMANTLVLRKNGPTNRIKRSEEIV